MQINYHYAETLRMIPLGYEDDFIPGMLVAHRYQFCIFYFGIVIEVKNNSGVIAVLWTS